MFLVIRQVLLWKAQVFLVIGQVFRLRQVFNGYDKFL